MLGIWLISLGLRFWNLGQFNTLVFDEVYFAKYANNYLIGKPFFDSHPPLSGYLIAIGIWIGSHVPASPEIFNNLTGSWRSTISYRWLNAFIGSFLPLILGAIAYQLTHRRSYSLIIAFLSVMDGLFLVESRYALNNIYLVSLGLLGQLFFLIFLNQKKLIYLTFSGIGLGLAASIKWNGLGFFLGIYLIIFLIYLQQSLLYFSRKYFFNEFNLINNFAIFQTIQKIQPLLLIFNLFVIPLFTYSIVWLPYLILNPQYGWWTVHQKMWSFHQSIGDSSAVHPYCSQWYSWLIMARPIAYFYETKETDLGTIIYDVHAMGNPVLWWLATGAILSFLFLIACGIFKNINKYYFPLCLFILINYFSNLLPWLLVNRCTFLYHYMASYVFSWLALGWIIEQCLMSRFVFNRRIGIIILLLIFMAFIYWLPIYLGLPLSQTGLMIRLFLPTWI